VKDTRMDYKNTLNLPRCDFPMKADLSKREPLFLEKWRDMDLSGLIRKQCKGRDKYILHDGPPYANGDIHIGHALNKILKDIIVKFKTMQGFDSAYVPGWDCHGLPVEHQLFKELGINKYQIKQLDFRKKAFQYAMKFVNVQKEQFRRLGVVGDWNNPYLTLNRGYEEDIVRSFGELVREGYIYRGLKPVNWCFVCETALAEAEVEYDNHTSHSVVVKFEIEKGQNFRPDSYLVIWTTTPWTLIANVAVAVAADFKYSYIRTRKGNLVIAKNLLDAVLKDAGIEEYEEIGEFSGRELEGVVYSHPFGIRKGRVVLADYVSGEEGTGLVHTAPGHGNEDYSTGIKYKLDIIMPVDNKGRFDSSTGEFSGKNVLDANEAIINKLKSLNVLLFSGSIEHSYPHCWRCKSPVIFRATKQWFLSLEHKELRGQLLKAINNDVAWIPSSGKERISAMVELRPDWCLSRQRYWGVPIPALICNACKEEFLMPEVIDNFAGFVAKEGSDCWFAREAGDFVPAGLRCPKCAATVFSKGADILDVWFDSGVSSQAVLKKRQELEFPCALYLEGSDQHRGWFQSSLIPAMCIDSQPPFKNVLTHGFVVDGEGRKMSKSLGNVISPQEVIKVYGADILRLWVASSDYNEDIRISPEIITRLSEAYRKIRNTARFILSNLYDFKPEQNRIKLERLRKLDKWLLFKLSQTIDTVSLAYERFQFHLAYKGVYNFCNEELSMYYLDMIKGRLYTFAPHSPERRSTQAVIYQTLNILVRLMSPLLAFTADEIWQYMPKAGNDAAAASVHLLDWPVWEKIFSQSQRQQIKSDYEQLKTAIDLIPDVAKALEEKRSQSVIGSSFDAQIILLTNSEIRYTYLRSFCEELPEIFKVSQVCIEKTDKLEGLCVCSLCNDIAIRVEKAKGIKCQRCWNYSNSVGESREHPLICNRCLKNLGEGAKIEK